MKTLLVILSACILLAIVAENSASPLAQIDAASFGREKPGSCYRPGFGRKRRSLDVEDVDGSFDTDAADNAVQEEQVHFIEKRQIHGGNPWRPPTTQRTTTRRPQCYNDYDCSANKKCCSGVCQTPSFVG